MLITILVLWAGCTGSPDETDDTPPTDTEASDILLLDVQAAEFVGGIDNPYLPFPTGATWAYEVQTDEGLERVEVEVLVETKEIHGVTAAVVRDTARLDGVLVEDTHDWYAQDADGNVWYLGEETCEYEDDVCVDTYGSWEWGTDGALPGLVMPGSPAVDGQPYFQEYFEGEAEDVGEVVEIGISDEVPAGSFADCVRTHDTSAIDPELNEYKVYCRGVGMVRAEEPDGDLVLVEMAGL